jgi:hypothetical protein
MYGLVNRALEGMVRTQHGDAAWENIKKIAGVNIDLFTRMDSYPDEMTYQLVGAAAECLDIPGEQLLKDFGSYMCLFIIQEGYGSMMDATGKNFHDVILNLDDLHTRISFMYPDVNPPIFNCTDVTDDCMVLHYHSSRVGLAPMIIGFLDGLARHLSQKVSIEQLLDRNKGDDHDSFKIRTLNSD